MTNSLKDKYVLHVYIRSVKSTIGQGTTCNCGCIVRVIVAVGIYLHIARYESTGQGTL
jgi:hypothetical protein